jgi:hypothetical protein
MYVNHRRAVLQLIEQRLEPRITKINAARIGEQDDAVQFKNVKAVLKRPQRSAHVGQGQRRETAETVWAFLD